MDKNGKILTYRITYDSGFAPNPFGGVLTLAACTPNHIRANIKPGDWIVGVEADGLKNRRNKKLCCEKDNLIIYIAKINEVMTLDEYFNDGRFDMKKFNTNGGWEKRRGDNVYYIENGMWKWIRGHEHDGGECEYSPIGEKPNCELISKDTKGNRVFISFNFSYFGDACIEFEKRFLQCLVKKQGIKYCYKSDKNYNVFLNYLKSLMSQYGSGKIGNPILCTIGERACLDTMEQKSSCKSKI